MASILKVDTIQDQDGNNIINESADTITIGASGDTITIPSGATITNSGTATGFGKVLQVVSVSYTSSTSTNSTSYSDIGISASITPSSTSNTILVNYSLNALTYRLSSGYFRGWIKTLRGATDIQEDFFGGYINVGTDNNWYGASNKCFIDSPSSTSSLTYKLQFKVDSGANMTISETSKKSNLILMEIEG